MAAVQRSDSNTTETRISEETSFKTANGSAVWELLEPNSFSDASAKFTKVSRTPIKNDRQREKGVLTDLDANFGFNSDITQHNLQNVLQGLFRAVLRNKTQFGGAGQITGVVAASDTFTAAAGLDAFAVNDLVVARRFSKILGNNGLHRVTAAIATALTSDRQLTDETPPANALLVKVGVQTAAGDIDVDASQVFPALTSTTFNFVTAGLIPGEYIWIGGDLAAERFATNPVNNCLARIRTVATNRLTLDKCSKGAMITEAQAGQTIRLFFGRVLKNELGSLIVRKTYQIEQQLNKADTTDVNNQSQYFVGSVFSAATVNWAQADKVTMDCKFMSADQEVRSAATGLKAGTRPAIEALDAQNGTTDLKRIRLARVINGDEAPSPLVTFIKNATINIDNGDQPLKALTVLGAFDFNQADFVVSGNLESYFTDIAVIDAVRNNLDCTLDLYAFKDNAGWVMDMPLITLSDAGLNVSKDQPIMLPLAFEAASGEAIDTNLDYTLCTTWFDYLPTLAATPNA